MKELFICINQNLDRDLEWCDLQTGEVEICNGDFNGKSFLGKTKKIVPANRLIEIYIVEPEKLEICYMWRTSGNRIQKVYESFATKAECRNRFNEIENILCKSNEI